MRCNSGTIITYYYSCKNDIFFIGVPITYITLTIIPNITGPSKVHLKVPTQNIPHFMGLPITACTKYSFGCTEAHGKYRTNTLLRIFLVCPVFSFPLFLGHFMLGFASLNLFCVPIPSRRLPTFALDCRVNYRSSRRACWKCPNSLSMGCSVAINSCNIILISVFLRSFCPFMRLFFACDHGPGYISGQL